MLTISEELVSVAICSRSNLRSTGLIGRKNNKILVHHIKCKTLRTLHYIMFCYKETKFNMLFSMLLLLFAMVWIKCTKSQLRPTKKQMGTMVILSQHCNICGNKAFSRTLQPLIFEKYLCSPYGRSLHLQSTTRNETHGIMYL